MGRVIYSVASSLDGYNAGPDGDFSWAMPDEAVIDQINADLAGVSTYLYGRRMYETMSIWETDPSAADDSPATQDFVRLWVAADKVVFSTTMTEPVTTRTRIVPRLDRGAIERERDAADGDCTIEGPTVARQALELGVVDVVEVLVCPAVIGGGNPVFPDGVRTDLRRTRSIAFDNGMQLLTYEVRR